MAGLERTASRIVIDELSFETCSTRLKRHIGELSMEIELLRERARAAEQRLPLAMRTVATMSATTSAATGRCFGIQRVCQVWERFALGALRAAGAGTPPVGRGAERGGGRRRGNRTRKLLAAMSDRSRAVPVPRR